MLTWREDGFSNPGWHIPGGIIRYKEIAASRIIAVAASELGTEVEFEETPIAINEIIHPSRSNRGHFISLLFKCWITKPLDKSLRYLGGNPKAGEWAWHKHCPTDLLDLHDVYRKFL